MTARGHGYGLSSDVRFSRHQRQPRADKLDKRQRQICKVDAVYAQALSERVSDANRWSAFVADRSWYETELLCKRCGSNKRRVYNRECWTCRTNSRSDNWQRILAGQRPLAARSRDGHLALLDAAKRERRGEFEEYSVGPWLARQYPTGRLHVRCACACVGNTGPDGQAMLPLPASSYLSTPTLGTTPTTLTFECQDLGKADPRLIYGLVERNPELFALLQWASWA